MPPKRRRAEASDSETDSSSDSEASEASDSKSESESEVDSSDRVTIEDSKKQLAKMQEHFVLLMIGSRGSGKTFCLLHLLVNFYRNRFGLILIISPTWMLQPQCKLIDGENVMVVSDVKMSEPILQEVIKMQEELDEEEREDILIVYDDTGLRLKQKEQYFLIDLLTRGRHSRVSIILLAQKLTNTLSTARSQADGMLLWHEENPLELSQIWQFQGFDPDHEDEVQDRKVIQKRFLQRFKDLTVDKHSCALLLRNKQHWEMHPFQAMTPRQIQRAKREALRGQRAKKMKRVKQQT